VSWQTEGLYKRSDGNGFDAWSAYSQVLWGFKPRWVAGLREDYVGFPGASYRVRSSPNITWYPSEFSKIRLQYNLDCFNSGSDFGHAVWLQFEFMLGAHGAHKF